MPPIEGSEKDMRTGAETSYVTIKFRARTAGKRAHMHFLPQRFSDGEVEDSWEMWKAALGCGVWEGLVFLLLPPPRF